MSGCEEVSRSKKGAAVSPLTLRMSEEELKPVPYKGWAA
jgi:hypothetical protein